MPARVYICSSKDVTALKKLLEYDPYLDKSLGEAELEKIRKDEEANVIFARQDYLLKDGISLGLERDYYYLYVNATEEFLAKAEKKLKKALPEIKRAEPGLESKIVATIEEERNESEQGLGLIFGG